MTLSMSEQQQQHNHKVGAKGERHQEIGWSSPLALAIFSAAVAGIINAGLNYENNRYQLQLENRKSQSTLSVERENNEAARILQMLNAPNADQAATNLSFLAEVGLISDPKVVQQVKNYANHHQAGSPGAVTSSSRTPGALAYTGSCENHQRIACYIDANGVASVCRTEPC